MSKIFHLHIFPRVNYCDIIIFQETGLMKDLSAFKQSEEYLRSPAESSNKLPRFGTSLTASLPALIVEIEENFFYMICRQSQ